MQVGINPLTVNLYRRRGVWRPMTLLFRTAYLPVDPLETLLDWHFNPMADWQATVKHEVNLAIRGHGEH